MTLFLFMYSRSVTLLWRLRGRGSPRAPLLLGAGDHLPFAHYLLINDEDEAAAGHGQRVILLSPVSSKNLNDCLVWFIIVYSSFFFFLAEVCFYRVGAG